MSDKTFLDKAYGVKTPEDVRDLYDDWAQSYDAELTGQGYATPARIAGLMAQHTSDTASPVLDFGCGTGLSGQALLDAGFSTLDGADVSAEMLEGARAKGLYRALYHIAPDEGPPGAPGTYAAIAAIGVIGHGAAPLDTFDRVLDALAPGGLFALSFNDHALSDPAYEARVQLAHDTGAARLVARDHGDHIPGIGLKATVYLLEKA